MSQPPATVSESPSGAEESALHPLVAGAAAGVLPRWAVAGEERRAHMERVATLLDDWAVRSGASEAERARWRAAGRLHDTLREEDPERLREHVPPSLRDLPGLLLHGPAAAERLRMDGVRDGALLRAVAFHTIGDAGFGRLGRALYAADFLEPGRTFEPEWRATLRDRMPAELDRVVREIVRARIAHVMDRGMPLLARTVDFWNALAGESA